MFVGPFHSSKPRRLFQHMQFIASYLSAVAGPQRMPTWLIFLFIATRRLRYTFAERG
jgi:hypothetical protein